MGDRSGSDVALGSGTHRGHLTRERIIEVAIEYVDDHGLTALTMRRLGKELGVEAMSLYRYVNGREDLLEGMVDYMVATLHITSRPGALGPADGWQAYLQWLAHGVRALAREHPNVFPLIATRHPAAPWLRPPLRSLRVVEDFLTTLISRGFSDTASCSATSCSRRACSAPRRRRPKSRSTRASPTSRTRTSSSTCASSRT
jgi:TetR/AcrR family tetracycline transcriptional repressor